MSPRIRSAIDRYFGKDAFSWFDRSYISDWAIILIIWLLSGMVSVSPVYKREFLLSDQQINHQYRESQVGSALNHLLALFVPISIFVLVGCIQRSLHLIHHGAIGLCAARGVARLITVVLKHSVGRLRPDFLARCKWDEILLECTGKKQTVIDGRKSFPSGHSSTAFSGMFFLSLWMAGQTAAWCFSVQMPPRNLRSSRMTSFFLSIIPLFWATHVAVTRIQDYKHDKEDVCVGGFIGIASAFISYLIFWPNPFSPSSFDHQIYGQPRVLYTAGEYRSRNIDFELGRHELEEENVV